MSWYFSIFGGYLYQATEEEEKVLDAFQIPLTGKPDTNCKKCHGKFSVGFDVNKKHFIICPKCTKKYVDVKKIVERKYAKKTD